MNINTSPASPEDTADWLSHLPFNWEWKRLKELCEVQRSGVWGEDSLDDGHDKQVARTADIKAAGNVCVDSMPSRRLSPREWNLGKCLPGDILVVKSSGSQTNVISGRVAIVSEDDPSFAFSNFLLRLRPLEQSCDSRFIYFALVSNLTRQRVLRMVSTTTYPNLNVSEYLSFPIATPSLLVQKVIANYLNRKTAAIDALIEKKRRQVELLAEKRAGLINQAVTKGLDPNVPMKDSGIPWIGGIPAHWELYQIKRLARTGRKTFTDGDWIETPYITTAGIRLLQTGNIGIGEYRDKGFRYVSEETFRTLKCVEVHPGDLLICRLDGPVGRACLAPNLENRMITSVDNAILKPADSHDPRYFVYTLNLPERLRWLQTLSQVGGGHRWRISRTALGELHVPSPPSEEQRAISDHLDEIDLATRQITLPISLLITRLQEYRQALITAAVTGQLEIPRGEIDG